MTITTLYQRLRRVIRVILLIFVTVILQSSSGGVFSKIPHVTAQWEIASPNNHLGDVIKATVRITTQPGMTLDISQAPNVGDILPLPPKIDNSVPGYRHYDYPPEIPEGELEVVSRRITQYSKNGLLVTEIDYELQYLLPIDLSAPVDDKRLPWDVSVFQSYQRFFVSSGKVDWLTTRIFVEMADFYIVPRVDENSRPIFTLFELTPPATHWPHVRLIGFGCFGLALGLLACWGASGIKARRRRQDQIAEGIPPDANELYQIWCENPDQAIFIEALKLYRSGIWGRPQASTWIMTTFILYSGVPISLNQTKTVFARLIKEASDVHSP